MPRNIRYVKPSSRSISFSSIPKNNTDKSTSEKFVLFLVLFMIIAFFVLPQWIDMFKQLV